MKIFQKKMGGRQPQTKIEKRVANIATPDLVMWAENALYVIGKEVTHWMRDKNEDSLEEAALGAEALTAIINELKKRSMDV
jgi:hypothetical protein